MSFDHEEQKDAGKGRMGNSRLKSFLVLGLFAVMLTLSVVIGFSLIFALLGGYVLFYIYALSEGLSNQTVLQKSLSGILVVKNILITFILIGILTGLWRACGTIASIVSYSSVLIRPSLMVVLTFLLNCLISVLTGTSFGTAATMGTICMTMAKSMGMDPLYIGGAVLAGAFFGDRCSPVSTSALLVSELTGTDIYDNIRRMIRTVAVPFVLSIAAYYFIGKLSVGNVAVNNDISALFEQQFRMGVTPLIPAIVIFALAIGRVNVKIAMAVSIVAAVIVCVFYQGISAADIVQSAIFGFEADVEELTPLINGGGIKAMIKVFLIVCISSCYSGIFEATGILNHLQALINRLAGKISVLPAMIPVSAVIGMIACNQTLTIMLTHQVFKTVEQDNKALALYLEDTAVVISALIPWSIAGAVPLATCGAPPESRLFAFILYLLPLCDCIFLRKQIHT